MMSNRQTVTVTEVEGVHVKKSICYVQYAHLAILKFVSVSSAVLPFWYPQ